MERARAIYDYAIDLQPEQRRIFLQQISTENPALLAEVQRMLDQATADTQEVPAAPAFAPTHSHSFIFSPGDLIAGRYRVLRKIAKGGMGEVYEVHDLELHSRVALKVISLKSAAKPNSAEMFRREILLARQVTHPNVCRIYDIGHHEHPDHGDLLFLTMEFLEGTTLADRVRTAGPLTKEDALPLIQQMVHALAAAHRLNIAHRDFKSGNVILCDAKAASGSDRLSTPSGAASSASADSSAKAGSSADSGNKQPLNASASSSSGEPAHKVILKVTDFGLARSVDGMETTFQGEVWGTPDYMAPEQFHGHSSTASDIYALGVVIYEMFTAKLPHRSNTGQKTPDGKPSAAMEKIPAEWRPVVQKCMAYEPADRYATVEDVWNALNGEERSGARKSGALQVPRQTLAGIAVALLITLGLAGWMNREAIRRWFNPLPQPKHIAVLPFHNVGDDPANQAFCDGVQYSLSSKLSQLERFQNQLWVVPADDARTVHNPDEAFRKLAADLVITGSVQRTSEGAVLTINLVDAKKHKQIASRVMTASMGTLDTLQDRAWEQAASMIDLQVSPAAKTELAKQDTRQPNAYDFYMQGVGYLERVHSDSSDIDNAIQMFTEALQKDRNFALAYAGLGRAYGKKYWFTRDPQWFEKASWNGQHAIDLDDKLAPVHFAMGSIYERAGQADKALSEYQKALELDPSMIVASRQIGEIYAAKSQFAEAEAQYRRVIASRPGFSSGYLALGNLYMKEGKFEAAGKQYQTVIDITPDNPLGYQNLAAAEMAQQKYDQAIELLHSALKLKQTSTLYSNLGSALMYVGRYPEAVDAMEKATQLAPHNHVIWRNLGDSYRQVPSQKDKAAGAYEHALAAAQQELKIDPAEKDALAGAALYEAHLGHNKQAESYVSRALSSYPEDNDVLFTSALVYEIIGNRKQALTALDKSWKEGFPLTEIEREPELSSLRSDSRYQSWLKQAQQSNSKS